MAKIALVWELGGHLGHIVRYAAVARELIQRGHEPVMLLRDTSRADEVLGDMPVRFLQAPIIKTKVAELPPAINFAETLMLCGYYQANILHSMVDAWRNTFNLLKADLLIFDHAPVARLASHIHSIPSVRLGSSFAITPQTTPFPPYAFWQQKTRYSARLQDSETHCLGVANEVLAQLNIKPVSSLADLFHTHTSFISTHATFDVYGQRNNAHYVGALVDHDLGASPRWPIGNGPKVFVYLKPKFKYLDFILTVLRRLEARVIAYVPGLSTTIIKKFQSGSLSFSENPLSLSEVAKEADYAVCHAGAGTIGVFADAGVPQFLIPLQMEQMMNAARVAEQGIALFFPQNSEPQLLQKLFKQFFSDKSLKDKAQQWAAKHSSPPLPERVAQVCDGIEENL